MTNIVSTALYALAVAAAVTTYPSVAHAFLSGIVIAFGLGLDLFVWWVRRGAA